MESKLLTIQEVAGKLRVSYTWLDRKARAESINIIWLGGKRFIHVDELDRIYLEGIA